MKKFFKSPLHTICNCAFAGLAFATAPLWAQSTMPMSPASASGKMQMPAGMMKDMPKDMRASMMTGMDSMQKMPMSGDVDKDFAMMMKLHHQQALDMAQMELEQGKSTEMKAMARKIIIAQKKEIAQFDAWLAKTK
jgi:uncharacterized protein (DUF305 family)